VHHARAITERSLIEQLSIADTKQSKKSHSLKKSMECRLKLRHSQTQISRLASSAKHEQCLKSPTAHSEHFRDIEMDCGC